MANAFRHADGVGITFLVDGNFDRLASVHTDNGFPLAIPGTNVGNVPQVNGTAFPGCDNQAAELFHGPKLVDRANQVALRTLLKPPGRYIDVFRRQPGRQHVQRQVQLGHLAFIDFYLDFVFETAADLDRSHTFDRLKDLFDLLVRIASQDFERRFIEVAALLTENQTKSHDRIRGGVEAQQQWPARFQG